MGFLIILLPKEFGTTLAEPSQSWRWYRYVTVRQNGHERKAGDLLRTSTRISIEIANQAMSLHAGFQCYAIPNTRLVW